MQRVRRRHPREVLAAEEVAASIQSSQWVLGMVGEVGWRREPCEATAVTRLVADLKSTTMDAQIAVFFDWAETAMDQVNFERQMVTNMRFLQEPLPRIGRRLWTV